MNNNLLVAKKWLYLSIFSLTISGLYSILIVALRTPILRDLFLDKGFFKTALIIHVDCSVVLWFLSFAMVFITSICNKSYNFVLNILCVTAYLSLALICISPFVSESVAIINNYVPILHNIYFILGISLFATSIFITIIIALLQVQSLKENIFSKIVYIFSWGIFLCMIAFQITCMKVKKEYNFDNFDLYNYYEILFWSGGHLLQFIYSDLLIIAFYLLSKSLKLKVYFTEKSLFFILLASLIFILVGFYPLFFLNLNDAFFVEFYTKHMIYLGGILPTLIGIDVFYALYSNKTYDKKSYIFYAIIMSLILFFSGGVIGILISGTNVTIPAHYHGSIIGITVALMALTYYFLELYTNQAVKNKLAKLQILLYSVGQLIHIIGLSRSGGYGVLRKDPNTIYTLDAKMNMALMGAGGFVAILGGILFVIICYIMIFNKKKNE